MTYMENNLLTLAYTSDTYTHIRLEYEDYGHSNHIWTDKILSEWEIHQFLDSMLEEFEYPVITRPISIIFQENGILKEMEIAQFCVED
jgi:hypothetical protein